MPFRALPPQSSASTSFATRAMSEIILANGRLSQFVIFLRGGGLLLIGIKKSSKESDNFCRLLRRISDRDGGR